MNKSIIGSITLVVCALVAGIALSEFGAVGMLTRRNAPVEASYFAVIIKSNLAYEAGILPAEDHLADVQKFIATHRESGVLKSLHILRPSGGGRRIAVTADRRTSSRGPFHPAESIAA
jgi:hypothetical protein